MQWDRETLYLDGDSYFDQLSRAIDSARISIDFEVYIFQADHLGLSLAEKLCLAAGRGVRVRLIIDGVGSLDFPADLADKLIQAGVQIKVYHPIWAFRKINKRTHRKLVIIDHDTAWLGSMNVTANHLSVARGGAGWRDLAVCVCGQAGVRSLATSFDKLWNGWSGPHVEHCELVRLNMTRLQRMTAMRSLITSIDRTTNKLWITNAYFVPIRLIMRAIIRAHKRGVDVRVMVPEHSDIFFMPWVIRLQALQLLSNGVVVYAFHTATLHTKCLIADNAAIVGSTNMNHRSAIHDLEADVVLTHPKTIELLEQRFQDDIDCSRKLTIKDVTNTSLILKVLGWILLRFREIL
jgi:cardiolipin synthase